MGKTNPPSILELQAQIEFLQAELAVEQESNRRLLGLPGNAPGEELIERWSTEWMQSELDACEITHGAVTQVYKQVVFKLIRLRDGTIVIRSHDGRQVKKKGKDYAQVSVGFSTETFFMLLELMEYAEREFGLDRKAAIVDLTGEGQINIKQSIANF
jgi:hypothetical protein